MFLINAPNERIIPKPLDTVKVEIRLKWITSVIVFQVKNSRDQQVLFSVKIWRRVPKVIVC